MNPLIALGWTTQSETDIAGVSILGSGSVRVLATSLGDAETAKGRLQIGCTCLASGARFLPISPYQRVSADLAQRITMQNRSAIQEAIRKTDGMVQLTLAAGEKPLQKQPAQDFSGRSWLRGKAIAFHCQKRRVERSIGILDQLTCDQAIARISDVTDRGHVSRQLLVAVPQVTTVIANITHRAKELNAEITPRLLLTGPWPPFSFVNQDWARIHAA